MAKPGFKEVADASLRLSNAAAFIEHLTETEAMKADDDIYDAYNEAAVKLVEVLLTSESTYHLLIATALERCAAAVKENEF